MEEDIHAMIRAAAIARISSELEALAPKLTTTEFLGLLGGFIDARMHVTADEPPLVQTERATRATGASERSAGPGRAMPGLVIVD